MELSCCFQVFGCLIAVAIFIYRTLRLPKSDPSLSKSFLRKETSEKTSSPAIIAHRGGSAEAPENTLAAFKMAKDNGAYGVEFDVDFTKDGKAVVIHDSTVDRTTNGKGLVGEFTFEEIRKLDASCKHPLRWAHFIVLLSALTLTSTSITTATLRISFFRYNSLNL